MCRCVLDEHVKINAGLKIQCVNRFEPLVSKAGDSDELMKLSGDEHTNSGLDVQLVGDRVRALGRSVRDRRLRVATWNFSGLGSERKQKEIILDKNGIDAVARQESWEKEDTKIAVEGYKWFGKPCGTQNSQRGEGGVGFFSPGR